MDLHSIAGPLISAVNPMTSAKLYKSTGYSVNADGIQVPAYAPAIKGMIQVQGMSNSALQHANSLNITGVLRKVYLGGDWESVVRTTMQGGDKFVFSHAGVVNGTWLVATVNETWPDWCSVTVQLQVEP